ncbi:hypothetical protein AAHE18_17G148300 [Arachis hypogaea]
MLFTTPFTSLFFSSASLIFSGTLLSHYQFSLFSCSLTIKIWYILPCFANMYYWHLHPTQIRNTEPFTITFYTFNVLWYIINCLDSPYLCIVVLGKFISYFYYFNFLDRDYLAILQYMKKSVNS